MRMRVAAIFLGALICVAQTITPLSERAEGLSSPALSPDGKMLAYDREATIVVRPLDGGKAVPLAGVSPRNGFPTTPRWSPDGARIAFLRFYCHNCNEELFVKPYPSGPEKLLGDVCDGAPSWTPEGRFLIATELASGDTGSGPCRLVLIPLDGGPRVRIAKEGDQLALTADGKRLAYAAGNVVKTVNLDAEYGFADAPVEVAKEPHAISSLYWSADGRTLLYEVRNYTKVITDGAARVINPGALIGISQILADGSALGTEQSGPSALWRFDLNATPLVPERVRSIPWTDEDLSVSPDGQRLVFSTVRSGATQVWVSRLDGNGARVLVSSIPPFGEYGDRTMVDRLSWSPDGKWIALMTQPGVGHGVDDARLFVIPSSGGRLWKVADCSMIGRAPVWFDSATVYIGRTDEHRRTSYSLLEIATGRLTPIGEEEIPRPPLVPLPSGARNPHVAQNGRYLYYESSVDWKARLVKVEGLLPSR